MALGLPSPPDCRRLLRGAGCPPDVVAHAGLVARLARTIAERLHARGHACHVDLVVAASHLHDIGRSRTHGLDHASVGAEILRARGLPEALVRCVERHTGGGIDPEEARALGLPVRDYTPRTLEEKVVCQADNLVDGTRRQKLQDELDHLRGLGFEPAAAKVEALHRELSALIGQDLDTLE